jgi:hypothetical protein
VGSGIPALTGSGSGSPGGGLPSVSYGFDSEGPSGTGAALDSGASSVVPSAASASNAATSAAAAAVPTAHHGPDPARRLRSGYALVLLAALAGVALVTAQFRIRPA